MVIFITKILVLFYVGQISFLEKVECRFCLKGCVAQIHVERGMGSPGDRNSKFKGMRRENE